MTEIINNLLFFQIRLIEQLYNPGSYWSVSRETHFNELYQLANDITKCRLRWQYFEGEDNILDPEPIQSDVEKLEWEKIRKRGRKLRREPQRSLRVL